MKGEIREKPKWGSATLGLERGILTGHRHGEKGCLSPNGVWPPSYPGAGQQKWRRDYAFWELKGNHLEGWSSNCRASDPSQMSETASGPHNSGPWEVTLIKSPTTLQASLSWVGQISDSKRKLIAIKGVCDVRLNTWWAFFIGVNEESTCHKVQRRDHPSSIF